MAPAEISAADKAYMETRRHFENARRDQAGRYDQAILWLAPSSVAFSITFLDKFSKPPFYCLNLLLASWALFLFSIFSIVLSHYSGGRSWLTAIRELDERQDNPSKKSSYDIWARLTDWTNALAGISFCVGALFLVVFACLNLPNQKGFDAAMSRQYENKGLGSIPPPRLPSLDTHSAPTVPAPPQSTPTPATPQ